VNNAASVLRGGSEEVIQAVESGEVSVDAARLVIDRPHEEQDAILDLVATGEARNFRQAIRKFDEAVRVKANKNKGKKTNAIILVGDSRELVSQVKGKPALVCMDPPYGIETHNTRDGGKAYKDGEKYIRELLPVVFAELSKKLRADAHGYCFAGYTYAYLVKQLLSELFWVQDNPIIWVKDNHTMCDFAQQYPNKHEYIWFFKTNLKGQSKRKLRECIPDVIEVPRENVTTHPAEKPTALLKRLIENSTDPGELVLDPFMGAGSTLVAAVECKRSAVGIELDEKWADIARSRL
jgi:DNA modification methylase